MNVFAVSGLVNAISVSLLGAFVYIRNRASEINKRYALFCFFVAFWCYNYFFWQIAKDVKTALFFSRGLMAGAIFIPICFLHFVLVLLNLVNQKKRILTFGYFIFAIFFILNFSPYFVKDVAPKLFFPFWPEAGVTFGPFLAIWFWYCLYPCLLLYKALRQSSGVKRNQLKYVLLGILIGYSSGSTNYFLWFDIPVAPYGNFIVPLFVGIMAFAIVKYNLMDIGVAFKELLAKTLSFLILTAAAYFIVILFSKLTRITEASIIIIASLISMALFYSLHRIFSTRISYMLRPREDLEETFKHYTETEVIRSHSVKELADLIVKTVTDSLKPRVCSLMLFDKQTNLYNVVSSSGMDEEIKSIAFKESNHLISTLKKSQDVRLIIKEELHKILSEDDAELVRHDLEILNAQISLPLILKGELVGLLNLGAKTSGELYTPEEIGFIFVFATQSAMMLRFLEEIAEFERKLIYAERLAGIDEMLGSTNHELHNLLAVIKSMTQILSQKEDLSPEDKTTAMQSILTYTERANAVTTWVNDYRRKLDYTEPIEVDINKSIEEAIPAIKAQLLLSLEKVQIIKNIPQDLPNIKGKATLPDLFFHLLTNSCYSMDQKGGQLTITVRKLDQDYLEIEITDTGGDITKPMERGPDFGGRWFTERTQLGGLNLFLARHITTDNQGTFFDPQSNQGKGAIFTVKLPIKQATSA